MAIRIEVTPYPIRVGGEEIEGNVVGAAVGAEFGDPAVTCRGGPAHLIVGADTLYRLDRYIIEVRIVFEFRGEKNGRFGSFQTSKNHFLSSSFP